MTKGNVSIRKHCPFFFSKNSFRNLSNLTQHDRKANEIQVFFDTYT